MQAKILCVYDEGAEPGTPLIGAKGISLLVEADGQRTLFDAGMRGRYIRSNMESLNIEAESLDRIVVSQGCRENAGGVFGVLENRKTAVDIYSPASARGSKGMIRSKGLFIPSGFTNRANLKDISDWTQFSEHLFATPPMPSDGGEECFLVLIAKKGPVVLSGRSGAGVDAVMDAVKSRFGKPPVAYIGGVLIGRKRKAMAANIAASFKANGCLDLYLNHCTTALGHTELRANLGISAVNNFYVGSAIEFEV